MKKKVIVDTNLWISFLLHGKAYRQLTDILSDERVTLVTSRTSIDEFVSVASRKKFAKYISEEQVSAVVEFILQNSLFYPLHDIPSRCRDPKDDYLLELAVVSNADYLLTGDDDLLSIKNIGTCKIATVSDLTI